MEPRQGSGSKYKSPPQSLFGDVKQMDGARWKGLGDEEKNRVGRLWAVELCGWNTLETEMFENLK